MLVSDIHLDLINKYNYTLVQYDIEHEYSEYRLYKQVTLDEILNHNISPITKSYSFGILTDIKNTNLFVLDIDNINKIYHSNLNYIIRKDAKNKKFNDTDMYRLDLVYKFYKKLLGDKLIDYKLFISSKNPISKRQGYHLFFILDDKYDVTNLYKTEETSQFSCSGFLNYTIINGSCNIRITNKIIDGKINEYTTIKY